MDFPRISLPEVSVRRGGITFDMIEQTPTQRLAHEQMRRLQERIVTTSARYRDMVVDAACVTASLNGWDVHIYEPPTPFSITQASHEVLYRLRYVGIEYTPAKHPVPTLHYHAAPRDEFEAEMAWEDSGLGHWLL